MQEIIVDIFGKYELIDGHHDISYIAGVVIFCIVLYSALRILGICLGGKK